MSTSVGEQIVAAMVTALNAPTNKPCVTQRSRVDALAAAEFPAFVLYSVDERADLKGPNTVMRTRTVRLEVMVQGEPPADVQLDPLYVYAVQTLIADPTLTAPGTGLTRQLRDTRVQWEVEASYQDVALALVDFEAVFVTTKDPSVRVTQ